ncbi:MAG TPA: P-loop NTPase fold protein, partial [Methanosarcina vacuolata]|nr:P-loop NTPase fold protein [Methanosarcina vacuolata]
MSGDKSESSFECLNDISTKEDVLGFRPYVEAIAEFLTAEGTKPPITLSIEGQWGCGKSSFMNQLKEEIEKKNEGKEETKYFTVWFNSWKYEKEEELWASFALNFMDELSKQLSWRHLQYSRLKLFLLRYKLRLKSNFLIAVHFSWSILSFTLIFSFLFLLATYVLNYLGMPLPYFIDAELIKNITNIVLILTPLVGLLNYFATEKWFIDVFRDPFGLKKIESNTNYKEHISFRDYFHADINEII